MRHFPHHIGDYAAATAHLSFVEDAAYHRLLRRYYQDEKPLPADPAAVQRLVGARSREERAAVHTILHEFFVLQDDGWRQTRADEEIEAYRIRVASARENGAKSGGRPKTQHKPEGKPENNPAGFLPDTQTKPSRTLTNNQEPVTSSEANASAAAAPPVDLTKLAFDAGVAVLTASGKSESSARGLVGKWRKQFGDEAVFAVLGECQRQSVTDPASWMEAALKARAEPRRKPWEKPEPGLPVSHNDTGQWRARVLGWAPGRFWNRGDWGPEPGEPGFRVPATVLAEWQAGQGGNA